LCRYWMQCWYVPLGHEKLDYPAGRYLILWGDGQLPRSGGSYLPWIWRYHSIY
jgi:hypothetical protein